MMKIREIKIWKEFNNEKGLYVAEPLTSSTASWTSFDDVEDLQKSTILHFDELKGKNLYIVFIRKNDNYYAKLYITDSRNINILYVRSNAVNPVQRYFVTKKQT